MNVHSNFDKQVNNEKGQSVLKAARQISAYCNSREMCTNGCVFQRFIKQGQDEYTVCGLRTKINGKPAFWKV